MVDDKLSYEHWGRRKKDTPAAKDKPQRVMVDWRARLKKIVFNDPRISVNDLKTLLDGRGVRLSSFAIAAIKRAFLEDVRFLRETRISQMRCWSVSDRPYGRGIGVGRKIASRLAIGSGK